MNNKDYLHRLKKLLSSMQRQERDEILEEISSHIEDSHQNDESLIERFGTAESLAAQYLEDNLAKPTLVQKTGKFTKNLLLIVGSVTVFIVIAISALKYFLSADEYNYADEQAFELIENRDQWSSIEWREPVSVHVDQAKVVFYWQAENEISWKCQSKEGLDQGPSGELVIRHNSCLFYLPIRDSTIGVNQSSVVLVRPLASTQIDVTQSELRIAENGAEYQYDLDSKHSDIESFETHDTAKVVISIAAKESTVSAY